MNLILPNSIHKNHQEKEMLELDVKVLKRFLHSIQ